MSRSDFPRRPGRVALLLVAAVGLLALAPHRAAAADKVDYNFRIRPLLADRCFPCHGPDEKARKAKLRLDLRDSAVGKGVLVPGKPEESPVVQRITADEGHRMPPKKSNLTLSKDEIESIRRWIAEGAEYQTHWSFLPLPDAVPVPTVGDGQWPAGPLDRFVLARLEREGLKPSPAASREDWLRRVTFDLTGVPPTPAEADAFLADESPAAFARVVDHLLASPRFGERFALDWLDAARYADSFGYQADGDSHLWPWRDWVVRAFNEDLPYDRFVTWQLAGDLLPGATRDQRLATAFCRLHRMTNEGGSIPEEWRTEYVADRVQTFGTALLGLTLECSRCHDHKFDPFTQKDYYSLSAFFNSIDEWGTYDNSAFRPTPALPLPTPDQEKAMAAHAREVETLAAHLRDVEKGREDAFKAWLARDGLQPDVPGLVGYFPLDRLEGDSGLANLAAAKAAGTTSPANTLAEGKVGKALRFTGDDPATFPAPASLDRAQPFTVSFWLRTPGVMKQGIVFHREAGTDTGFHGLELSFDDGRLFFGLIRFWPGNAAAVRTKAALPADEWVYVTASYDASGRAAGLRLYLDGKPAEVEVLRDRLTKNVEAGGDKLTFGERFRSVGLKGGLLDEVRIFDRALSDVEVAHLDDGKALALALEKKDEAALRPYYLAAVDADVAKVREELRQARARLFAAQTGVFEILTMEETAEPRPAYVLTRGAYDAPKDRPVTRDTPAALPRFPDGAPRDRLGLARWLTDPRHPLTARVEVNRVWQLFFGRGLVLTQENFGTQGALPSHPELLDWLARDFVSSGWDVKALCRQIVLSSTYRQRSAAAADLRQRDPDNVLLGRGPAHRLSAEELRDAALAAGGLLVEKVGGPPVKPYQPPGLWKGQNAFLPEYVPDKGEGLYRRSLYTFWRRTSPPVDQLAFDAPTREVCVVRRQTTSTPLQPLVLLNDPQFVEAARALGERMLQGGGTTEERVTLAFRLAATRRPTDREVRLLRELYEEQLALFRKDPEAARKFLKTGDRPPAPGLDPVELAAAAATAGAVLNLDAAVTTR
jgi:mono/diheme cytochrome c family protein